LEHIDGAMVSSVAVSGPALGSDFRLELRWHNPRSDELDGSLTPFLPLLSMLASRLAVPLQVGGAVDAAALAGAGRASARLAEAYGFQPAEIVAEQTQQAANRPTARGLFFSRGLDSFSTLVRGRYGVDVLLGLDWVDPPFNPGWQREVWEATERAASDYGLPLYRFTTNARDVLDPLMDWNDTHGAALVSTALLAGGGLGEILISSTYGSASAPIAHGSDSTLVSAWSTTRTRIVQASAADTRTAKAAIVATDPIALKWLKVCWEAPGEGNCGRCSKCLMTLSNFASIGALELVAARFRAPLTATAIRDLDLSRTGVGSLGLLRQEATQLPDGVIRDAWLDSLPG